jgi:hypothetical protein
MALALLLLLGQFGSGLFPDAPAAEGDAALQEEVERLLAHRIDLNRAPAREFLAVPWLNPFLAYHIVAVRESLGGFRSVEQLRDVPGMTDEVLACLRPFLRCDDVRPTLAGSVVSRTGTDSIGAGPSGFRLLNRLELSSGGLRVVALQEKDRGEPAVLDFLSAGAELRSGPLRVLLGDVTAGFGQGLVASAPQWQSSLLDGPGPGHESRSARLLSSALEGSYLRGGAVEGSAGNWHGCVLAAYTGRDARLNGDGSVNHLVGSGVHDDADALAGRNAIHEATGGLSAHYGAGRAGFGLAAEYSKYDVPFAPADSAASMVGDRVLAAGASAEFRTGHYELGAEAAGSSGGGFAGSFALTGSWADFDSRVALRGHQARFLAPHGRWSSLTNAKDRLDASGRLGWHHQGASMSLSGNTYRDFDLDSMPARLDLRLRQELGRFDLTLGLGLRYRVDDERSRTAKAEVGARAGRATTARAIFADVYPTRFDSRGTAVELLLTQRWGAVDFGLAASRVSVDGPGTTVYLAEPGAGRIGASYRADVSGYRLASGLGARLSRWLRLGLKAGCAWKPRAVFDAAAQLELNS